MGPSLRRSWHLCVGTSGLLALVGPGDRAKVQGRVPWGQHVGQQALQILFNSDFDPVAMGLDMAELDAVET
jgi:hypothetical protein